MEIKNNIQGVTPKADAEAMKSCKANKKEFDKVFKSRMVKSSSKKEKVNTKLELDESMFSEAKDNKAYKMKKVEDLDKDVYTYVYDCLFDGTHNYIPVNAIREKRFDVDRYVETPNKHHIGVKYENESEANKIIEVADDLFLPFKRDDRAKIITILLNSKTSSMPLEQFIDEMDLDKDEIGYEMVATRNKKVLKESKDNEYYLDVARHFGHAIPSETTEVISDIVDRAMSNIEDDYDIDEAVFDALDNGLIYHKDLWAIKHHYEDSALADGTFEVLYNDVYSIVSDLVENTDDIDEGLTKAERHNRNMDKIFNYKKEADNKMMNFLKSNSDLSDKEIQDAYNKDELGKVIKDLGLHSKFWGKNESLKESYTKVDTIECGVDTYRVVGGGFNPTADALITVEDENGNKTRMHIGDVIEFYTWYDKNGNVIHEPEEIDE